MTVGAEAELGAVLAKAKASVSATISATVHVELSHTYSHDITNGKYGHAQYGAWGKTIKWHKEQDTPLCTTKVVSSGTAIAPTLDIGWHYWETKS
jgi:hypothetical protein